jgi:hypothetical protein
MSDSREDVLMKALEAEVGSESVDLSALFTEDVVGWSPLASVSGLTALTELAAIHDTAFTNVILMFRGLDEVGNKAFAEWLIEADHTGPLVLAEDATLEATGRHVQLALLSDVLRRRHAAGATHRRLRRRRDGVPDRGRSGSPRYRVPRNADPP